MKRNTENNYFPLITGNDQGQKVYLRGCIKKPFQQQNTADEPFCEALPASGAYGAGERCYCYDDYCNGSNSVSVSLGLMAIIGFYVVWFH